MTTGELQGRIARAADRLDGIIPRIADRPARAVVGLVARHLVALLDDLQAADEPTGPDPGRELEPSPSTR